MIGKLTTQLKTNKFLFFLGIGLLLIGSLYLRLIIFNEEGGDHPIYKRAVVEFSEGKNPYIYTIESYENKDLDRGYAYPPTILYILTLGYAFNKVTNADIATAILWKVPVLLADLGIAFLLLKYFYSKNRPWLGLLGSGIWLINPYFLIRYEYTLLDPFQILFLFLALWFLGKRETWAGVFYALAVSTKIVPIILFPIFFLKSKNKKLLLLSMAGVFLLISLPFFRSIQDLIYYIQGSFLVHGERFIQGRPVLSYVSYHLQKWGISFYQEEFPGVYSKLALLVGPLVSTYLLIKKRIINKYALTTISFGLYFLLTPVFNRTHCLWILPFLIINLFEWFKDKKFLYLGSLALVYLLLSSYLFFWDKGLKPPSEEHENIWIGEDSRDVSYDFRIIHILKTKFYEYRGKYYIISGQKEKL